MPRGLRLARWGIEIEARHREALHAALMTGVRHALARGAAGAQGGGGSRGDYVRTSVPDALRALRSEPEQLVEMAEAKLEEIPRQ